MVAYYNDIEPYAAQWLRNLIDAKLLPHGDVDTRSIKDVRPDDLRGYEQCHFFAGIGGWPYALRLAGWPDDEPVWTGSCPCQPISSAGKRRGHADERHLWPAFHSLISECKPATIFGEQVASADGREWLSAVRTDLERLGYAVGSADLPAASIGAPHIRQRLFWMADTSLARLEGRPEQSAREEHPPAERDDDACGMADSNSSRRRLDAKCTKVICQRSYAWSNCTHFDDIEWLHCTDGFRRPTHPGIFPLAHGVSNRVAKLRAIGNAIVPQVAAKFVTAAMQARYEKAQVTKDGGK